jgi:hypothetical protein
MKERKYESEDPERLCQACRLTMSRAIIRRLCIARRAVGGSAMPTLRTTSGIRVMLPPGEEGGEA